MSFNDAVCENIPAKPAPNKVRYTERRRAYGIFALPSSFCLTMVHICRYEVRQVAQFTEFPKAEN